MTGAEPDSIESLSLRMRAATLALRLRLRAMFRPASSRPRGSDPSAAAWRRYSQHGEDGIILHLLNHIAARDGSFVEFGFAASECNCLNLALRHRFHGLFLDGDEKRCALGRALFRRLKRPGVIVEQAFLTRENLNDILARHGYAREIDVLSIDVDGNDAWLFEIVAARPRLVVIEYNASFGPERAVTVPYDPNFRRYAAHESGFYYGASLAALERLAGRRGYRLVATDPSGVNAFFLRTDLGVPEIPTLSAAQAFRPNRGRVRHKQLATEAQFALIAHLALVEVPI
jgi:hypothetical protein